MRLAPTFSFLRRSSDRAPAPRVQDPADLGTAFGFEASLEQVQPVRDNYAQLESQRPHPPLENPMAWVRRSTPSFLRIDETCDFTVPSEMPRS